MGGILLFNGEWGLIYGGLHKTWGTQAAILSFWREITSWPRGFSGILKKEICLFFFFIFKLQKKIGMRNLVCDNWLGHKSTPTEVWLSLVFQGIEQLKKEERRWAKKTKWMNMRAVFGHPFSLLWFSPFSTPDHGKAETYQYVVWELSAGNKAAGSEPKWESPAQPRSAPLSSAMAVCRSQCWTRFTLHLPH